jgi:hypothetical protein
MRFSTIVPLAGGLAVALVAAGCASNAELAPAPGTSALPAPEVGAAAITAGVRLEARTDIWTGRPAALGQEFTPILVSITNRSHRPLMVRYKDFNLMTPAGAAYAAMPPFRINGSINVIRPYYHPRGFLVAPYLAPYYDGWRAYDGFPRFDDSYFNTYYPYFRRVRLPTPDMLRAALPEGVLRQGGTVTGFLYFERVPDRIQSVALRERLETPHGRSFGDVRIPFVNH